MFMTRFFQHNHCLACFIDWEYIGRYDGGDEEVRYVAQEAEFTTPIPITDKASKRQKYLDQLISVAPNVVKSVALVYQIDLEMYGYITGADKDEGLVKLIGPLNDEKQ